MTGRRRSDASTPGRAELHFHLLPGVDDGPESPEVSVELARMAVRDGTTTVVATPHFDQIDTGELAGRVAELAAALEAAGVDLSVLPGAELSSRDVAAATAADLARVAQGPPDARWILLEAPLPSSGNTVQELLDAAEELGDRGYGVLLGHPERSPALCEHPEALPRLLAAGAALQVNASSLLGRHDPGDEERGMALARRGVVALLASDAHRPTRGPALTPALDRLVRGGVAEADARRMVDVGPRMALTAGVASLDPSVR
jgi:protein-tyrosine phosphatase